MLIVILSTEHGLIALNVYQNCQAFVLLLRSDHQVSNLSGIVTVVVSNSVNIGSKLVDMKNQVKLYFDLPVEYKTQSCLPDAARTVNSVLLGSPG